MQFTTRFRELENVVLIPENYTQEIQKNLEVFHSSKMFGIFELEDYFQKHQDIGFLHYEALDKEVIERLEYQIGKVSKDVNYGYACLSIGNVKNARSVFIKDIEYEFVTYFQLMHSDSENQFWHAHKFNLKHSDYEIVYCIIRKLTKNRLFEDIEEFEKEYKFYKALFKGNEKEFLNCLLYPDKLDGYAPYPYDYNVLENYSELKTRLFERKNNLIKVPAPPVTGQPTKTKESETDLTDDQNIIYNHIKHLKGNNQNREKIMTDENFDQLFNDLCYLVENNEVPEIKKPLSLRGITNISLFYTIRLIHNDLIKTRKIRPSFKKFLKTYFETTGNYSNYDVEFSKARHKPKIYPY